MPLALVVAFYMRLGVWLPTPLAGSLALLGFSACAAAICSIAFRLPWIQISSLHIGSFLRIAAASVMLAMAVISGSFFLVALMPRAVPVFAAVLFGGFAFSYRLVWASFIDMFGGRDGIEARVAIYGAGAAGNQLATALRQSREMKPVFFIDDNRHLDGHMVAGLRVYPPARIAELAHRYRIDRVLVAMPSAAPAVIDRKLTELSGLGLDVRNIPSYVDLILGSTRAPIRPVSPADLLGRSQVDLADSRVTDAYSGKVVMVTGAGGSIGSELCRQVAMCNPRAIVLYEQSEFGLYSIDLELRSVAGAAGVEIVSRLGSVANGRRVAQVIAEQGVEVVLHAAAYKHVPIVEQNEIEGAQTNIFGTRVVARAAISAGVERFVLISTDKAVRPTNIMGATKRLAELVVQDLSTRSGGTRLSMVRFGNVLGSSGSVVPLFERQIANGGPVTVTHPDVTRYFMTIPEASRLVLLAGALSDGGEVFVLDMGEARKIADIARQMIRMSGRTVKDPHTGFGDIEIRYVGLRPGEKLYEELLIDDDSLVETTHPLILRAREEMLGQSEMERLIARIESCVSAADATGLRRVIARSVRGYHRPAHPVQPIVPDAKSVGDRQPVVREAPA